MRIQIHRSASTQQTSRLAGFTLAELLVTMGVGAVLAAVALPNFSHAMQSMEATTVANDFIADLAAARSLALRTGQPVVLCRSLDPASADASCSSDASGGFVANNLAAGWILFQDTNADGVRQPGELLFRVRLPQAVTGSSVGLFSPASWNGVIVFNASGLSSGGVPSPFLVAQASGGPTLRCINLTALGASTVVRGPCQG